MVVDDSVGRELGRPYRDASTNTTGRDGGVLMCIQSFSIPLKTVFDVSIVRPDGNL